MGGNNMDYEDVTSSQSESATAVMEAPVEETDLVTPRVLQILGSEDDFRVQEDNGIITITERESEINIMARIEKDVIYFQAPCVQLPVTEVTLELTSKMLASDNGISTSNFQLIENGEMVVVALTNFAVLQDLGTDDEDDIKSCVRFLMVDLFAAKELIES